MIIRKLAKVDWLERPLQGSLTPAKNGQGTAAKAY